MPKWFSNLKDFIDFLSLGYRPLFILTCLSWTIIIIPKDIWQSMGLLELSLQSRPWMFVVGVISGVWLLSGGVFDLLKSGSDQGNKWWLSRKTKRGREKVLSSISRSEKQILVQYLINDVTTLAFDARDGVVNGLIARGILYKASTLSNPLSIDFDVNIQPWAWQYLNDHPEIMDGIIAPKSNRHQF